MDPVSDRKVNVVCTLGGQNFQKRREKPKKNDGKTGIFTQNKFSTKSIFLNGFNSKTNHCKFLKFSPNIYVMSIKNFWMTRKLVWSYPLKIENLSCQNILKIKSCNENANLKN
ncbi:Uncharacterized protein FWK35_00023948 [Aphis craccivora]|uniref:Uncharacterized protein n=1 Tax=Aphis craccivora TaxID=307492 RepID=A0A6G0YQ41_APHCR|nr:Uncharacterized protein FWK35_00023948 [Aphis craccivora]